MAATPVVGASCNMDNNKVVVSFIYDASTNPPLITTVEVVSTDTVPVPVHIVFMDLNTGAILTDLSGTVNPGTKDYNVAPFNQHMVSFTSSKFGTYWVFPYIVACS